MFSRLVRQVVLSLSLGTVVCIACAEIVLDGSVGPGGSLSGPNYLVPAEVGSAVGSNLFHSFGVFNINTGESATFAGPSSVSNIISRVTGGSPSTIDGLLRSEIPNANLFLLNPAGVLFGRNASLSIDGSFHVSTADYLGFADGARLDTRNAANPVLSIAPPASFGFLGDNPGPISLRASQLQVRPGEHLSFSGGKFQMAGGALFAQGGRINVASVRSPGEVDLDKFDVKSFSQFGDIAIDQSGLNATAQSAGSIVIRGGAVAIQDSIVQAGTTGDGSGGAIDIQATESVKVSNAIVGAGTFAKGPAGTITIAGPDILVERGALIDSSARGGSTSGPGGKISIRGGQFAVDDSLIQTNTFGDSSAGDVSIDVARLNIRNGGQVDTSSCGMSTCLELGTSTGAGGKLEVSASELVSISGQNSNGRKSGLFSNTSSNGNAEVLKVTTPLLIMEDDARIVTRTLGGGNGGKIEINAAKLMLTGGSQIFSGIGSVQDGVIVGDPAGTGAGGQIIVRGTDGIRPSDSISISGKGPDFRSGIFSSAQIGMGKAGDIDVSAGRLAITGGATIDNSTVGIGQGGSVSIRASEIALNDGSSISAKSNSQDFNAGASGEINVSATDTLRLVNGSAITVETERANAGNINVKVGSLVHLRNNSEISTSANDGEGDGGNITIDPDFVVLDGGSRIIANAKAGRGGNISIRISEDGAFLQSPDSFVRASSDFGVQGSVVIDSPDTDVSASVSGLPVSFFDASALVADRCATRVASSQSSFVVTGRGAVPPGPAMPQGVFYFDEVSEPSDGESGSARSSPNSSASIEVPAMILGCSR